MKAETYKAGDVIIQQARKQPSSPPCSVGRTEPPAAAPLCTPTTPPNFHAPLPCLCSTCLLHAALQGDTMANKYYVVERGAAEVLLAKEEWGPEPRKVHELAPGR